MAEGLEGDLCLASLSPGGLEPMRRKHCEELPASQASWTSQEGLSKRSRAATDRVRPPGSNWKPPGYPSTGGWEGNRSRFMQWDASQPQERITLELHGQDR